MATGVVVAGGIEASPLYVVDRCIGREHGVRATKTDVNGRETPDADMGDVGRAAFVRLARARRFASLPFGAARVARVGPDRESNLAAPAGSGLFVPSGGLHAFRTPTVACRRRGRQGARS
jgi:hypothetical protein